ncbi:hypothetical protein BU26DRAFT_575658 [Trematosphaeria pertusa]|uniref:Uncharacterized protein n=1 Tax=Trematosphaeria pertusa TaxID=390896 RepID=A0A6A6J2S1_9PLEO|nr:uncharacterized protein BU26DRAFT_575658 [Trematosphaeria pertusa]KAF2257144.1 hypothetical protein BU26DRAFT_575658 [Trematosphaeria pertusa]
MIPWMDNLRLTFFIRETDEQRPFGPYMFSLVPMGNASLRAMEEQKRRLLEEGDNSDTGSSYTLRRKRAVQCLSWSNRSGKFSLVYVVLLHLAIVFLSTALIYQADPEAELTPAAGAISYITKVERSNGSAMHSQYTGPPSERNNRAWEDLVSREQNQAIPSETVILQRLSS